MQDSNLKGSNQIAVVNKETCNGCCMCIEICPLNAISFDWKAAINEDLCDGCGICVNACPRGSLSIAIKNQTGA